VNGAEQASGYDGGRRAFDWRACKQTVMDREDREQSEIAQRRRPSRVRLWTTEHEQVPPHFFFQAEDGIRDYKVTGVQTCALPILQEGAHPARHRTRRPLGRTGARVARAAAGHAPAPGRSEERRVGKECRASWSRSDN